MSYATLKPEQRPSAKTLEPQDSRRRPSDAATQFGITRAQTALVQAATYGRVVLCGG